MVLVKPKGCLSIYTDLDGQDYSILITSNGWEWLESRYFLPKSETDVWYCCNLQNYGDRLSTLGDRAPPLRFSYYYFDLYLKVQ
jgi:hypothetical protein